MNKQSLGHQKEALTQGLHAIIFSYLTLTDFRYKISRLSKGKRALLRDSYYKKKFFTQMRHLLLSMDDFDFEKANHDNLTYLVEISSQCTFHYETFRLHQISQLRRFIEIIPHFDQMNMRLQLELWDSYNFNEEYLD